MITTLGVVVENAVVVVCVCVVIRLGDVVVSIADVVDVVEIAGVVDGDLVVSVSS